MVKVEKLSENRVKLTVTISVEEFDKALDLAFEKVVKEVKVDGFRPGKMPKRMFIQRFGWESLYNDAIEFAVNESYYPALKEANVYPTSQPKIDLVDAAAIKKGEAFDYTVEIDVWPEVHLGEYKGVKVKKASTRVLKKDVEEFINKALQSKTDNVLKDTPAEKGDTVILDFEGFIDGVAFEGGKAENYSLELGSNSFVPGFEDQLVGAKTNDEVEVKVTFPENYHEGLANKEAVFKCKIHEVKTKKVPELNDEFVSELDIENVKTVEEYQEYAKEQVKKQKVAQAEQQFENDCINAVCEASYASFPQSLIDSSVEQNVARLEQQAKQYNIPVDALVKYMGADSIDEFKKVSAEQANKQFLHELIFDEIIKKENIEATKEEIEAKYLEIAGGKEERVAEVKKQYNENQIAYQVKYEKAVKLIKDNAETK